MGKFKGAALLVLSLLILAGLAQAQSKLTIPESIFNFGKVPQNSKISHIFWLYSTGEDSLIIKKVKPG